MRLRPILAVLLCAQLLGSFPDAQAAAKSDLRVLLVAHDPEAPKLAFADHGEGRSLELYQERTLAFRAFLESRFEEVRVVYSDDYLVELSDDVDVTIFDARPKALTESKREVDPETGEMVYEPATYLPESFDHPALTISDTSPRIGEPLGLKLDWL